MSSYVFPIVCTYIVVEIVIVILYPSVPISALANKFWTQPCRSILWFDKSVPYMLLIKHLLESAYCLLQVDRNTYVLPPTPARLTRPGESVVRRVVFANAMKLECAKPVSIVFGFRRSFLSQQDPEHSCWQGQIDDEKKQGWGSKCCSVSCKTIDFELRRIRTVNPHPTHTHTHTHTHTQTWCKSSRNATEHRIVIENVTVWTHICRLQKRERAQHQSEATNQITTEKKKGTFVSKQLAERAFSFPRRNMWALRLGNHLVIISPLPRLILDCPCISLRTSVLGNSDRLSELPPPPCQQKNFHLGHCPNWTLSESGVARILSESGVTRTWTFPDCGIGRLRQVLPADSPLESLVKLVQSPTDSAPSFPRFCNRC